MISYLKGEVILPSFTFIATAHALSWFNIKPVFVTYQKTLIILIHL